MSNSNLKSDPKSIKLEEIGSSLINPATEETLQSIVDSNWVPSSIDVEDATNYYFLSFIPGTTKWRIKRLNQSTYVSDYAIGDSSITTAWSNRTTQTYSTTY